VLDTANLTNPFYLKFRQIGFLRIGGEAG